MDKKQKPLTDSEIKELEVLLKDFLDGIMKDVKKQAEILIRALKSELGYHI